MRTRRVRVRLASWLALLLLGLLIWAKLRLVTGIPRTVLAEPREPHGPPAAATAPR